MDMTSGQQVYGETENLGKSGCCVRTRESLPPGNLMSLEIKKDGIVFATEARVAYKLEAQAMGVAFLNVPSEQLPILAGWLQSAIPAMQRDAAEEQQDSGAADAVFEKPGTIGG